MSKTIFIKNDLWINWYWSKDGSTFYYIAKGSYERPTAITNEDLK